MSHGASAEQVAELVTFRINEKVCDAALLKAAATTNVYLKDSGAILDRSLSRDETGLLTD